MKIVNLNLVRVAQLLEKNRIVAHVSDGVREWITREGHDVAFGARPLKRVIQKHIMNPLATRILEGEFGPGDTIAINLDENGSIRFEKGVKEEAVS